MKSFYKKFICIFSTIALLSFFMVGCGKKQEAQQQNNDTLEKVTKTKVSEDYVVSAEWLAKNLDKDVLILDGRGEKEYNKGHIPGAINVAWQQFSKVDGKPGDASWGTVLDKDKLSEAFSKIGVDKEKTIVAYCNTKDGWGEDGRLVWMFKMAGVDNAKMLDGGWNYWKDNDYETSKEAVKPKTSDFKVEKLDGTMTINTDELKDNYDSFKVLDSRKEKEYKGSTGWGEARGGHLPNAKLLTFTDVLNEDGTFKSVEELQDIFKKVGLKKEDKIVTYCTAGIRSAHLALALKLAGYDNAKNYDESFYRWAALDDLKLEK